MSEAQQPSPGPEPAFALAPDWSLGYDVPVFLANVFLAQVGAATAAGSPEGLYLVAGHVAPPMVLGTPEEVVRHVNEELNGRMAVDVNSRIFMTRDRAVELINLLTETVAKIDAAGEGSEHHE